MFREERESQGINKSALARMAGVNHMTVDNVETGRREDPQWSTVVRLADALGLSLDEVRRRYET